MKPGFALLFNDNGLELLRRAKAGWQSIGTAALDDDLATNLTFLRRTATEIAGPAGLASKLVLPREQILVTTQTVSDPSGDVPAQIKTLLVGMTPYDVGDLRFDWRLVGDQVQIAAIATETLEEAEQFALDNGFNPLSFAAEPLGDDFDGEASFGTTKGADAILKGAVFVPDQEPTAATMAYVPPVSEPEVAPDTKADEAKAEPKVVAASPVTAPDETPSQKDAPTEAEDPADDAPADATPHSEAMIAGVTVAPKPATSADAPALSFQTTRTTPPAPSTGQSGLDQVVSRVTPTLKADDPAPSQDAIKSLSFAVPSPTETPKPAPKPIATTPVPPAPVAPVIAETPVAAPAPPIEEPDAAVEPAVKASAGFTVFGARKRKEKPPLRTRLGLMMTASLIILMVLIALLYRPSSDAVEQVETTTPEPSIETAVTVPAEIDTPATTADDNVQVLSLEQAEAAYAETGIWQLAALVPPRPATDDVDDIFIASIDPNISATDAIALPAAPEPTVAFAAPINPAPAGQNFDIGTDGIIIATPEGITTPEGARVFAGGAPSRPLARPASIVPPVVTEDGVVVVLSQSEIRPTPRPDDIAERIEQATQNGPSRAELAGARPQPRPEALIARVLAEAEARAAAEATAVADAAAAQAQATADAEAKARVEAALAAAAEADLTPEITGTELALASVAPPPRRPNDIADTAKKLAESTTVTPATRQATVTTPSIPTRSSVTQAATVSNVIPLRKVAVIGIFGSSSNRSALIRAANGRTSTVKVGDRVDGGRVTAISETEVRYTKGNRNLTLAMPKS